MLQLWFILALLSAVFFALKDIAAKKWLSDSTNPKQLLFGEYFLLFSFLSIFLVSKVNFSSFADLGLLYFLKAATVGGVTIIYFSMLKKYEISSVSPLLNLSPMVLLVFSFIFLSELLSGIQVIGIFLMILSTYYLETITHHHNKKNPHKTHFKDIISKDKSFFISTFVMLILMSFAAIFDKIILTSVDVYSNMFFTSIFILSAMVFFNIKKITNPMLVVKKIATVPVFFVAVFSIISNFLILFSIAIPTSLVSLIIPIRRSSTLFSSLFGGLLFHEKHLAKKVTAIIGMILSLVLIVS
ncbi:EamA family transporter [archaeon]|nr:EamA family transporter [archaeon]